MAKKPNPPNATNKNKTKKSKKKATGPNAIAMKKQKATQPNPFETIWSRRKFDILGKKRKGEERRLGLARSLAIEKRKKTLLKEYEQSGKSSAFVDKRIGEETEGLEEFDKAILRSQRERQLKINKKSKYNLSDGEEDEFEVQDGLSFSERDDFDDEVPFDEDEDGREAPSDRKLAIGGQVDPHALLDSAEIDTKEGEENRHKSKKEVMEEIILKSKFFKAQKAKDKEENEDLINQLDKEFTSLVQSKALLSLTEPDKMKALKALANKSIPNDNTEIDAASQRKASNEKEKPDAYDKMVFEMVLDMRARPSDRTKTPEEIAQEEKERLERLEEERQKRMVADDSSDEDGYASEDKDASMKRLKSTSGDDLGDYLSLEEEPRNKLGWIDEILRREKANNDENENASSDEEAESVEDDEDNEEADEDEDDDEAESTQCLKDWEQSDDENIDLEEDEGDDSEDGNDVERDIKKQKTASESKGREKNLLDDKLKEDVKQKSGKGELPYTIEAPKSLEELTSLLENRSDDQIVEAIRRIRTFNAITVAAENRKKMQVFYGVLLQYFAVMANKKPLNFKLVNLLVKPLMEMSAEIPYFAAICARQRLLRTRTQFCEDIKSSGRSCWPSLKTLFLLRLWSMIFPCSDFRHAVMTPAILLMSEYLMRCPIISGRDIAIGSFLCSLVLSVTKQSRKFCPEVIIYLRTLLMSALDKKPAVSEDSQLYHLMEIKALKPLLCIRSPVEDISPVEFFTLMDMPEDSPHFSSDGFRAGVLFAIMENLHGFVDIYKEYNSFPEIFLPVSRVLRELAEQNHIPNTLQDKIRDVNQLIEKKVGEHQMLRQPLRMRRKKPVPIKTLAPKFEEDFVKGRDYDPDRERAERRKLKKLMKREAKGAARELRKDNYFLFEVKEKDKARQEEEKAEKYGKVRAFLQEQEHAFKSGQLGKNRKRRK